MSVTDISRNTQTPTNFIKEKYIQKVLQEEVEEIFEAQDKVLSGHPNLSGLQARRSFAVSNTEVSVTHALQQRFIDMRYISGRKQKRLIIHNSIIYGHFNNIINRLAYGFTQDIRKQLAGEYNVKLTGNG